MRGWDACERGRPPRDLVRPIDEQRVDIHHREGLLPVGER